MHFSVCCDGLFCDIDGEHGTPGTCKRNCGNVDSQCTRNADCCSELCIEIDPNTRIGRCGLGPVHTGGDTRQYTYMFFIKLATKNRLFYKEQLSILSRVASSVNKPLKRVCTPNWVNCESDSECCCGRCQDSANGPRVCIAN